MRKAPQSGADIDERGHGEPLRPDVVPDPPRVAVLAVRYLWKGWLALDGQDQRRAGGVDGGLHGLVVLDLAPFTALAASVLLHVVDLPLRPLLRIDRLELA